MARPKKIWIDLDNSPHVPFFRPIIKELDQRGFQVIVTARDCFQVLGLAELFKISYKKIGRHYGKNKILKVIGTLFRSLELLPTAIHERPSLSVSHGSRSQIIAASILRIPSVLIEDYVEAKQLRKIPFFKAKWLIVPEIIPENNLSFDKKRILKYPGFKEDVYVGELRPDIGILKKLGLNKNELLVTIRPPATEAHYHNPESEKLLIAVIEFLVPNKDVRIVILPRNGKKQTMFIKERWAKWFDSGKIIVPDYVVNGLNLIWHSDIVVSGGGTMNREAAVLGVPVYSIFRGKIGAVDQYLSESGKLILIKNPEEIKKKIRLVRRSRPDNPEFGNKVTLNKIVDNLVNIFERY